MFSFFSSVNILVFYIFIVVVKPVHQHTNELIIFHNMTIRYLFLLIITILKVN